MSTARMLIERRYIDEDPNISDSKLHEHLERDSTSVQFAAAYLNYLTEFRSKRKLDVTPAALASAYSSIPRRRKAESRGKQISGSLKKLVKEILEDQ